MEVSLGRGRRLFGQTKIVWTLIFHAVETAHLQHLKKGVTYAEMYIFKINCFNNNNNFKSFNHPLKKHLHFARQ